MSRKTVTSPPHFMPSSSGAWGGSGSAASPEAVSAKRRAQEVPSERSRRLASSMTIASSGPPPTVPAMEPSGATSILAPASRGAERAVAVTAQSTNGSRASLLRAASLNSSTSVSGTPGDMEGFYLAAPLARTPERRLQARSDRAGHRMRLRRNRDAARRRRRDQPPLRGRRLACPPEAPLPRRPADHPRDHPEHLPAHPRRGGGD